MRGLQWIVAMMSLLLLVACGNTAPQASAPGVPRPAGVANISVQELKQKLDQQQPVLVLDVRTPEEYTGDGHIAGSRLIPLQELNARANELPKDQPIACICRSGNRSQTACGDLNRMGFTNLMNVEGGMRAWAQAGFVIER